MTSGLQLAAAGDREALGAPAHGPADVQPGGGLRAARQHERLQRLQRGVDLVAALFQPRRLLGDTRSRSRSRILRDGYVGADVEQVVLDPVEPLGIGRRQVPRS